MSLNMQVVLYLHIARIKLIFRLSVHFSYTSAQQKQMKYLKSHSESGHLTKMLRHPHPTLKCVGSIPVS